MRFASVVRLLLLVAAVTLFAEPLLAVMDEAGEAKPDLIADGTRVTVRDGDFSMTPPKGWEVYIHHPNLTLLTQVPYTQGSKYQRTIQVASFAGPRYIDDVTAREYEEVIPRKFGATNAAIQNYRMRSHLMIDMADSREALLFYSEFTLEGTNLMQAHILTSSGGRHYLITYTDVAEHFENEAANQFLAEAWDAMTSVKLGSPTPKRFAAVAYIAMGAGVLTILGALIVGIRRWRASLSLRDYDDEDENDGEGEGGGSQVKTVEKRRSRSSRFEDDDGSQNNVVSLTSGAGRAKKGKPKRQPPAGRGKKKYDSSEETDLEAAPRSKNWRGGNKAKGKAQDNEADDDEAYDEADDFAV